MKTKLLLLSALAVLTLPACEGLKGFTLNDAVRIGGKAYDIYTDLRATSEKAKPAKADAKAANNVQPPELETPQETPSGLTFFRRFF